MSYRPIIILSLLLLSTLFLHAQYDVYDASAFIQKAGSLSDAEKYDEAITAYDMVHKEDPKYLEAQQSIAYIHLYLEKYDEGIAVMKPLYEAGRFSEDPYLFLTYGTLLMRNENFEECEKVYAAGIDLVPGNARIHYNTAVLHYTNEQSEKAIEALKKAMTYDPNYTNPHYLLSTIAFENGDVGLGSLAGLAYMANNPEGKYMGDVILALNEKMGSSYLEENEIKYSKSGDDFSQLDFILRGEFPLDKKYKLECNIDDVYTRHAQAMVDYAAEHELKDGFFENIYIPYLADIKKKKYTESFIYWTLTGLSGDIGKKVLKNKKQITDYNDNYFLTDFWPLYGKRKQDLFGTEKQVVTYLDEGLPQLINELKDGKLHGVGKFVDKYYRTVGKVNYKDNVAHGRAEYYDPDGTLNEVREYKEGKIVGENNFYYKNGSIRATYNYSDGDINGQAKSFYMDGSKNCIVHYKDGKLDGPYDCYFQDGSKKISLTYKNDVIEGERTSYYTNGQIEAKDVFKENLYNGTSIGYNHKGEKLYSIKYKEGEVAESYTQKDKYGDLSYEYIKNGDKILSKNYEEGKLINTYYYNKSDLQKIDFYYKDKQYLQHSYKNNNLAEVKQFSAKQPKGKSVDTKNHKIYSHDGELLSQRKYKNGKLDGKNVFYYKNGNKRSEINYKNGKEDGPSLFHDIYGRLSSQYVMNNDTLKGKYILYNKGDKRAEYFYKDNELNGPLTIYYYNGKVSVTKFFVAGTQVGREVSYRLDGSIDVISEYENGEIVRKQHLDKAGKIVSTIDWSTDGAKEEKFASLAIKDTYTILNGKINGKLKRTDTNNKPVYEIDYVNGKRHGTAKFYGAIGKLTFEGTQVEGNYEGMVTYNDQAGVLYAKKNFIDDDQNGPETYFYPNGKKRVEQGNRDDKEHGETKIYNMEGELLAKLQYHYGLLTNYWLIGQSEDKDLDVSEQVLEGTYPNGNKAISISVSKMYKHGKTMYWANDGKVLTELNYKEGLLVGERSSYHANGQLYTKSEYKNGRRHGETVMYDENGSIILKYQSAYNNLNGPFEIYENGKLTQTKIYTDDLLIEIR